jgi:hypothetical protein
MTTYTWKIIDMPCYTSAQGQTDVVFEVNWQCIAQENHNLASSIGSVDVNYVSGESFTAYEDLTEDQVWGWINPSIDKTSVEADLQTTLNAQASPSKETKPLPW